MLPAEEKKHVLVVDTYLNFKFDFKRYYSPGTLIKQYIEGSKVSNLGIVFCVHKRTTARTPYNSHDRNLGTKNLPYTAAVIYAGIRLQ